MSLGDRIKARRLELGLSQEELAQQAGISQQSLSHIEKGERKEPRASSIAALAGALKVSVESLVSDERPVPTRYFWEDYLHRLTNDELYAMLAWTNEKRIAWTLGHLRGRWSTDELAELLDMPEYQVIDLMAGKGHITQWVVDQLTTRLELPTRWLIDGDPGPLNPDLQVVLQHRDAGFYVRFLRRAIEEHVGPDILNSELDRLIPLIRKIRGTE